MQHNISRHFFEKFKWNSIFVLNLKRSIILIAVPLILINLFSSVYYYKNVSLESGASSKQMQSTITNIADNIFGETNELFNMISAEHGMDLLMQTDDISTLTGFRSEYITKLRNLLDDQEFYSKYIHSIDVYSIKAQYVLSSGASGRINNIGKKPWYGQESDQLCFPVNNGDGFFLCYNVITHSEKLGLIIFEIDTTELITVLENSPDKEWSVALYDRDGTLFYSSESPLDKTPKSMKSDDEPYMRQRNKYTDMASKTNDICIWLHAKHSKPIYSGFILMTILLFVLIVVLSFIIAYIISKQLYKSIKDIAVTINDVADSSVPDEKVDEIEYINHNILTMRDKNTMLEQELVKSFVELKKAQTRILQMQFIPHFLFNALNTVNASLMLELGVNNTYSKSIETIARILTASIDVNHYMITVEQEIEYCKNYTEIQSLISNNNFDTSWFIADNIRKHIVVKFSLQPLIENAFKHGIRHLRNKTKGILNIFGYESDDYIIFEIKNNGPLPDQETIQRINDLMARGANSDANHVGLFNVNKRIKLIFGDNYGCTIGTENDMTVIRVKMPKNMDNDMFKF